MSKKNRPPRGAEAVLYYFKTLDEKEALSEMKALLADPKSFFEPWKPDYHYTHIRGEREAITICYSALGFTDGKGWVNVGIALSAPKGSWNRKKMGHIAKSRMLDCPVQFEFRGLEKYELPVGHIVAAVRSLIIESPPWFPGDKLPLRPGRFTERWQTDLIGPQGSLITARVDVKPKTKRPVKVVRSPSAFHSDAARKLAKEFKSFTSNALLTVDPYIDTWCTRFPKWAQALMRES